MRRPTDSKVMVMPTSRCIDLGRECRAQATIEAALVFPVFLTLLLFALQPVCLLYTRAVMESAAAETARLMVTGEGDVRLYRRFALRRLAAVPDLAIFHAGGPRSWEVECASAYEMGGSVKVAISGHVRPLPVIGAFARALGAQDAHGDVLLEVDVEYEGRPSWLEGSYGDWISVWG